MRQQSPILRVSFRPYDGKSLEEAEGDIVCRKRRVVGWVKGEYDFRIRDSKLVQKSTCYRMHGTISVALSFADYVAEFA